MHSLCANRTTGCKEILSRHPNISIYYDVFADQSVATPFLVVYYEIEVECLGRIHYRCFSVYLHG